METGENELFADGCDPDGVVEECGADGTRGLRPRAIGWVCSAYLLNQHPGGVASTHCITNLGRSIENDGGTE